MSWSPECVIHEDDASSDSTIRLQVLDSPTECVDSPWNDYMTLECVGDHGQEFGVDARRTSSWVVGRQTTSQVVMSRTGRQAAARTLDTRPAARMVTVGRCTERGSGVEQTRQSRPSSASTCTSSAGSTLSTLRRKRAEFHGAGRFTRYRYPVKFHQPITNSWDTQRAPAVQSSHAMNMLPASLRTTTRYGQEPTVQSSGPRRRVPIKTRPPRSRKTVETIDRGCQCSLRVVSADSVCQAGSGATTHVDRAVNTSHETYQDAAVMTTQVETISRMTETDVRLVDLPQIDYLTSKFSISLHMNQIHSS